MVSLCMGLNDKVTKHMVNMTTILLYNNHCPSPGKEQRRHRTLDIYLVIPPYLGVFHVNLTPEVSNNTPWRIKHRRYHYRHYNKQWFTVCEDLVLIKVTGSLYCLPYSRHWYRKVACTNRSRLLSQW